MKANPNQMDLAFQSHSDTSAAAARGYAPRAPHARKRVYDAIVHSTGLTDDELQVRLRMNPSTERPRRIELQNAGCVEDSGRTRKTRSGMQAVVWIATGVAYAERFKS